MLPCVFIAIQHMTAVREAHDAIIYTPASHFISTVRRDLTLFGPFALRSPLCRSPRGTSMVKQGEQRSKRERATQHITPAYCMQSTPQPNTLAMRRHSSRTNAFHSPLFKTSTGHFDGLPLTKKHRRARTKDHITPTYRIHTTRKQLSYQYVHNTRPTHGNGLGWQRLKRRKSTWQCTISDI